MRVDLLEPAREERKDRRKMSRAFVINGDEWGYCIQMARKCSGADSEGKCMRAECDEVPEWEKPKRSLDEIRRAKIEAELKEAEERAKSKKKVKKNL